MPETIKIPYFAKARVLVYGDVMLDRYWHGDTARISPEAPVPVVCVSDTEVRPGGAANVALNLAALGCQVTLLGWVGQDAEGKELKQLLTGAGITCHFQQLTDYPTVTKLRVLGQNQQLLRLDFEKQLEKFDDRELLQIYKKQLALTDAVIFSDYAKGTLFQVDQLIQLARSHQVPVFVDPKSNNFMRYRGATVLTPNLKEFEAVVGLCVDETALANRALELIDRFDLSGLLITRGKHGMTLVQKNQPAIHLSAHSREVYDVTGAGDTVMAVLAASVAGGSDLVAATKLANIAAGLVVRKLGTSVVTGIELQQALERFDRVAAQVLTEPELLNHVAAMRREGKKIVMTNGCFDLLHAGHVQYLEAAKALGDQLIVAVNDDQSVQRLKGPERPLVPLSARMAVLAALRAVDCVVSFSEDTPARIIAQVMPDILVKGSDYEVHEIAGSDAVIQNGGRVLTLPLKLGFSTSVLIHKIRQMKQEVTV